MLTLCLRPLYRVYWQLITHIAGLSYVNVPRVDLDKKSGAFDVFGNP